MKFSVVNLGCKVNRVESDALTAVLLDHGDVSVSPEQADVIYVNTCTVTGEAHAKTRKTIRRLLRRNPSASVVATGCAVVVAADEFTALDARVSVVDKAEIIDASDAPLRVGDGFPTRVGIKVQDGCDNACTYCIVHVARGRASSVPLESIVEQAVHLEQSGVREIVLTGIDLGSYNDEDRDLADLLAALLAATDEARYRISSVEPHSIDTRLIEAIAAAGDRVCHHLHLPLQSGSDAVLRRMARHYDSKRFRQTVAALYDAIPDLSLTTDVIVGFPGETDEDFEATCNLVASCRFSKVHVFRYSKRSGTPAASWPDQVSPDVAAQRATELSELSDRLRLDFARNRVGSSERCVIEADGTAMTDSYYHVRVSSSQSVGSLVTLLLTDVDRSGIFEA